MRHGRKTIKLQRRQDHRNALLSNLVCSLIAHKQIKTTLAKAKAVRPYAEKMVTLGKRGDLHARRTALSHLHQKTAVKELFETIAPAAAGRQGGYTRITKLGPRHTDSAPMAFIEWVDHTAGVVAETTDAASATAAPASGKKKPAGKKAAKAGDAEMGADKKSPARKPAAKKPAKKKAGGESPPAEE